MSHAGFRATKMHAFFVIGDDDEEHIPAIAGPGGIAVPLVGTDGLRVREVRDAAQDVARQLGVRIEHVVFDTRRHVEWIEP